jgi:hypothetical protein
MKKTNPSHPRPESPNDVGALLPPVVARQIHESAAATDLSGWSYESAEESDIIEFARWTDKGFPPLRMHFHNEAQVTIVLSGARCFLVGGRALIVQAGQ